MTACGGIMCLGIGTNTGCLGLLYEPVEIRRGGWGNVVGTIIKGGGGGPGGIGWKPFMWGAPLARINVPFEYSACPFIGGG